MLRMVRRGLCKLLDEGEKAMLPKNTLEPIHMFPIQKIGQHGPLLARDIFKLAQKQKSKDFYPSITFVRRKVIDKLREDQYLGLAGYSKVHKSYIGYRLIQQNVAERMTREELAEIDSKLIDLKTNIEEKRVKENQVKKQREDFMNKLKETMNSSSKPRYLNPEEMQAEKQARKQKANNKSQLQAQQQDKPQPKQQSQQEAQQQPQKQQLEKLTPRRAGKKYYQQFRKQKKQKRRQKIERRKLSKMKGKAFSQVEENSAK